MNLTSDQKKIIGAVLSIVVLVIMQVAALFGIYVEKPGSTGSPTGAGGGIGVQNIGQGIDCGAGATDCVIGRFGRGLTIYSDDRATAKASIAGSTGTFTHAGFDILTAATQLTVTNGGVFTPTGTFQQIVAAVDVTPTLTVNGLTTGQRLILRNKSATTILFLDTTGYLLAGNMSLTADDTLSLIWDGTAWVETARSTN